MRVQESPDGPSLFDLNDKLFINQASPVSKIYGCEYKRIKEKGTTNLDPRIHWTSIFRWNKKCLTTIYDGYYI